MTHAPWRIAIVVSVALFATVSAFQGRPWPPGVADVPGDAPVLSPADEMKTFAMPPGYHLELVASEPLIQDPIFMDWDADGRLWVIEVPAYMPEINPTNDEERVPTGRIVVLEDTDADGRMDKRTVFMDGLVLPRALKVLDHGVLVGEPPNLWLVHDTNGDLKADGRELVTDTYGTRMASPEHNANGLTWAMDNWIYTSEHTGYLRWKNGAFELAPTLSRGQWGVTQDDAGRIYRDTNEAALFVDLVPARYYVRNPNLLRTRGLYESLESKAVNAVFPARPTRGVNRGYQAGVLRPDGTLASYTAVNSPTVYRGDRLPAELAGNVFVAEPAGNLVSRIIVSDNGSTLVSRKAYDHAEFLTSTDERFRPVNLSSAPDGTLYILDLYRGIVQHRNYITEYLRDQILSRHLVQPTGLGRVFRVVHDTTVRDRTPQLSHATAAELVERLAHPNGWWRDTAQRLLVERQDRSPAVVAALSDRAANAPDWRTRLHALWTLDGLDAIDAAQVTRALGDASRDVRVGAVRMSERWLTDPQSPLQAAVRNHIDDADWAVRRQVAATLGELPSPSREAALAEVLERHGDDPITVDAAISGLRGLETPVIERLLAGPDETPAREASIVMLSATVMRGAVDASVQQVFGWAAETTRPDWQRSALLRGAEVALLNAPMPGNPPRGSGAAAAAAGPAPCATCPGGRAGPGGAQAFPETSRPGAPAGRGGRAARAGAPAAGRGGPGPGAARGARGGGGGPMLRLQREPAIAALANDPSGLGPRAAAVLARIEWPGKPGAAAPVAPLTPEEQQRFNAGRDVYQSLCQACHQPDGRGREKVAASLVGSSIALGPADIAARVVLGGKEGTIGLMPPLGATLTDEQIAAALTYVRREWGQTGTPVDPATVARVRRETAGRTRPWTNDELANLARAAQ